MATLISIIILVIMCCALAFVVAYEQATKDDDKKASIEVAIEETTESTNIPLINTLSEEEVKAIHDQNIEQLDQSEIFGREMVFRIN